MVEKGECAMKKGEKRKLELLKIAYNMFLTKGYENTSVDAIIEEAGIAKGTYYYYFESKEAMLEEVCMMMISSQEENAKQVLEADIPIPQKVIGIISSFRPAQSEQEIGDTLNSPENALMHEKVMHALVETVTPLVAQAVEQGISEGIFDCDHVFERVRMILIVSNTLFDDYSFSGNDVEVFTDLVEKLLGAAPGTMGFVKELIYH